MALLQEAYTSVTSSYEASMQYIQLTTNENKTQHDLTPTTDTISFTEWNQLIDIKPPRRFRDTYQRDMNLAGSNEPIRNSLDDNNDKVVSILQNILRGLENDIEQGRRRTKEERRRRQRERHRRRELRLEPEMSAPRTTPARHVFSTVPTKPLRIRNDRDGRSVDGIPNNIRHRSREIRKHDSFSFVEIVPKACGKNRYESYLELGTRSLDRRLPQRTGSCAADWSRYSSGIDDSKDNDDDVSGGNADLEPTEVYNNDGVDNTECDMNKTETDLQPFENEKIPRDNDMRISPPQFSQHTMHQTNLNDSFESVGTPTNIRRKLKSFEILPNYKTTAKYTNKPTDYSNSVPNKHGRDDCKPEEPVGTGDSSTNTESEHDTSEDDDNMDIVFSSTLRVNKSVPNNDNIMATTYFENEFEKEREQIEDILRSNGDGLCERTGIAIPAVIRCKEEGVVNIRKKRRTRSGDVHVVRGREAERFTTVGPSGPDGTGFAIGRETERPTSAGTSGYSTDENSCKTTDSEDENLPDRSENDPVEKPKKQLTKYFLVLQNGSTIALRVDDSMLQNGDCADESCRSLLQSVSMSDLAIPDHVGWLVDQSENDKLWGVVIDMLFCVFEEPGSFKPREVIILPGCNIRPLVYNTAINGLHTNTHSQTITGISKFQFVIDDSSTGRKHVFGVDTQNELDAWYRVLRKASALDPEVTSDITTSNDSELFRHSNRRLSFDGELSKVGYTPSQDSTRRSQKMKSARRPYENHDMNGVSDDLSGSPSTTNGNQPSPRSGLVRNDSRRQSISDFKKRLRQEPKPEISKQQPVKATHFKQQHKVDNTSTSQSGKKLRSFGSFESLLKFKRKKRKSPEDTISNDDGGSILSGGSIVSSSSTESDMVVRSIDISANVSQLQKKKTKKLSRSLDFYEPKIGTGNGIVRRASDIKDRVFNRRPAKPYAKLGDLHDTSMHGVLLHKHHLKWQKLWCVVCRGCFYGFKSNSQDESAHFTVLLANCVVVFVSEQDKKQKHLYIFKLSQVRSKSIYLCVSDYKELMKWLTVLQMESNSVISNADRIRKSSESENDSICSSVSSQSGSVLTVSSNDQSPAAEASRSRTKNKKKAPVKPPRHFRNSSCPPPITRESGSSTGEDTLTSGDISSGPDNNAYGSTEDLPRYDKAVTHVWQNDRGYLFNAIRAKLTAYRKKDGHMYNKEQGTSNEKMMVVQDGATGKGSREVRRSRSFNARSSTMSEEKVTPTPTESPINMRKRHKPLVVKKISAVDLVEKQTIAGYVEKKSFSLQWIKYWFVLHEGTLFCYLTSGDNVTVDVLNLHGYTVASLIDKFRGKRFVIQLSHDNFTSVSLSMESREEMESWHTCIETALKQPSSSIKEDDTEQGACAGCESNRQDDVGEKRKQVKQKLLEEMLRQKYELEKKQAQRQKKQRNNGVDSQESPPYPPEFLAEEQRTCDVTRLRQRRMSAQLKVQTIQKQIVKPSGNKRGLFGFGKSKKLDENKNEFLQDQLKELNTKLHKLDTDLSQVETDKHFESYDVNQNRKSMPVPVTSYVSGPERGNDTDEEDVKRTSGIKNAMHKWTNKTFSKVSIKRKQASNGTMPSNGSLPNMKQNGEITMNGGLDNGADSDIIIQDEYRSLDSSVTDLTRPVTDLSLDLSLPHTQNGQSGSASQSWAQYNRSNSKSSTISSLSSPSPRREIDPSVLAEIDAFEELTRQVLGARSKETPTK